jgi:hypothetical protein
MTQEKMEITYMDFKILSESWNSYMLEDDTILKARLIMISYGKVENPKPNRPNFLAATHTVYGVESPPKTRGSGDPNSYTLAELISDLEPGKEDLKFRTLSEGWSEYVLEDSTRLSLRLTPARVMRTKKFDLVGNPQYVVQSVTVPKIVAKDPKKLAVMSSIAGTTS